MKSFFAAILLSQGVFGGNNLLTVNLERSTSVCCQDNDTLTCSSVSIHPSMLGPGSLTLPGDIHVDFMNTVPGNDNSFHYGSNEADMIITYNPTTEGMHGHAMTSTGLSFTLEFCGAEGHVWKEVDVESLGGNEGIDFDSDNSEDERSAHDELLRQSSADTTTVVTYSVKFYYTPSFAASTPDIEGFIDQVIAETNQGYANSKVPLQVVKFCTAELATIDDVENSSTMISNFKSMKSSVAELRGSADAAALLVDDFASCGVGYLNSLKSGNTVSVTMKRCAVGYYSFGHEIGHNIGLHHNPAVATNSAYPYGTGHLIAQGAASTGYRTILAYNADGHRTRVNYYSNPLVNYPLTGTPTGVDGVSNNAAVLIMNRMSLAAIGDETEGTCTTATTAGPTTAAPTTAASTTAATTTTSSFCAEQNGTPTLSMFKRIKKVTTKEACAKLCFDNLTCEVWSFYGNKKVAKRQCKFYKVTYKRSTTWVSNMAWC
jgi:hypothetical protein